MRTAHAPPPSRSRAAHQPSQLRPKTGHIDAPHAPPDPHSALAAGGPAHFEMRSNREQLRLRRWIGWGLPGSASWLGGDWHRARRPVGVPWQRRRGLCGSGWCWWCSRWEHSVERRREWAVRPGLPVQTPYPHRCAPSPRRAALTNNGRLSVMSAATRGCTNTAAEILCRPPTP